MKLLITGATGMVGSEFLRQALLHDAIGQVTALIRRPLGMQHEKLRSIIHHDFLNYASLAEIFRQHTACVWCLGIAQSLVSKQEYEVITYDYTLAAARAMLQENPAMTFLFVSGAGADRTATSRITFARVKGKTENALLQLPFQKLIIPRPGGIYPVQMPENYPFSYNLFRMSYPLVKRIFPNQVITSVELANVLLYLLINGSEKVILENFELRQLLKKI